MREHNWHLLLAETIFRLPPNRLLSPRQIGTRHPDKPCSSPIPVRQEPSAPIIRPTDISPAGGRRHIISGNPVLRTSRFEDQFAGRAAFLHYIGQTCFWDIDERSHASLFRH